jgi:hypothetical protein
VLTDKMQTRLVGACETLEATIREVALPLKTPESVLPSADGAAASVSSSSDAHNAASAALSAQIVAAYSDATRIETGRHRRGLAVIAAQQHSHQLRRLSSQLLQHRCGAIAGAVVHQH